MNKTAVIFWSSTGNTESMAQMLVDGIVKAGGTAELFRVGENAPEELSEYTSVALGCPAMGAEQLDETEFEPYFNSIVSQLADKKVFLFGSYGWGDGEWMRTWENTLNENGITSAVSPIIANGAPDGDAMAELEEAAKVLA